MLGKLAASLRSVLSKGQVDRELDDEIAFHIARETEENLRRGMTSEEARRAALVRFGGVEKAKEESREASRAVLLETVLQDVRYGLRSLRKNPGYATAAILTLALGIGANTAIFSVVHGVLLQSLPYGGGDRLVRVRVEAPGAGVSDGLFSPPEMDDIRTRSRTLDAVAEYHSMWFVLLGKPEPERVQTGVVSANFFDLLGVRPIHGRSFLPGEDKHGAEAVLVLSHDYWMRAFGGDASVVGPRLPHERPRENVQGRPSRYPGHGRELADGLEAVREFLDRCHAESVAIFARLTDERLREKCETPGGASLAIGKWLRLMIEHEIHHRGQLYMALGILGVATPPIYGLTSEEVRARSVSPAASPEGNIRKT